MTRMKVEKLGSVVSRIKAAVNDSVPAEFMPRREDLESYLKAAGTDPNVIEQLLHKFPVLPAEGSEYDPMLEPKTRRPYTRRKKLPSAAEESDGASATSEATSFSGTDASKDFDVAMFGFVDLPSGGSGGGPGGHTNPSHDDEGFTIPALPIGLMSTPLSSDRDKNSDSVTTPNILDPPSSGIIATALSYQSDHGVPNIANSDSNDTNSITGSQDATTYATDPDLEETSGKKRGGRSRGRPSIRDSSGDGYKDTGDKKKSKGNESHKGGRKLVWPLYCWICKEPMNRYKPYVICISSCKRAFHINCEGLKSSKLRLPLKPEECPSMGNTVEGSQSAPMTSRSSTDDTSGINTSARNSTSNRGNSASVEKVSSMQSAGDVVISLPFSDTSFDSSKAKTDNGGPSTPTSNSPHSQQRGSSSRGNNTTVDGTNTLAPTATGCTRITPNCVSRACSFCLNSYGACSNCHRFVPLKRLAKCVVKGCTSFYCYPKCLGKVRLIVPDKRVIDIHNAVYGNAKHLLDEQKRPIFICHAHTCWSCYDCDRYSYIWESIWRLEAYRSSDDYMAKAWQNLRTSCRGKVETSHFAKGKRIPRPPRYPDMRCYKSYLQSKRLNLYGVLNSIHLDSLYPLSDDEDRATFHKLATNVLLRCLRCDRTWCTNCLHPDVHVLPHSAKQIICQDCIHLQVAQCVALTSTSPNNQRNIAQREIFEPRLDIEGNHPKAIFRQIMNYMDEQHLLRSKISLPPEFLHHELFIPEPDLEMTSGPGKKKPVKPASGKRRITKSFKRNAYDPAVLRRRFQDIKAMAKRRVDSMRSKEFAAMVKECDEFTILRLCNDFRYQSSNIITDDSLRTIAGPTTSQRCTCISVCNQDCANVMRHIECNNYNCGLSDTNCGNRRFKNLGIPKLRLQHVDGKGIGAFTTETIERDELICEYVGEVITQAEFQRCMSSWSFAELDNENQGHWYIMKVHKDAYIDSTNLGNVARFINHSCEPNCTSVPYNVNGSFRMGVFAQRRIEKGEEVTYNYGFTSRGVGAGFKCLCGAKNCRGIVGVQPDMASESLSKIESKKHSGSEADTLSQLSYDLASLYISKDDNRMKQRPSPIDVLNGMLTTGDLYRHEQLQTWLKAAAESRIASDLSLPINPVGPILADSLYVNHSLLNYVKMLVLGGRTIKEWDMANTKEFAATIPWGIIALENNKVSKMRALESSCAFPDFYERGKRFIQTVCMVSSRQCAGEKGSENLQEVMDLTWGSTEPCFACGGYGDCKYCDHCGDVLHDDNACGDFYVDREGRSLCSVCQNSDHRYNWLTARDIDRECMAMRLWRLRMERSYIQSMETFKSLLLEKPPEPTDEPNGSKETPAQIYIRPESLFCPQKDYERFCKNPLTFYDKQVKYHAMCQNAIKNYNCFW